MNNKVTYHEGKEPNIQDQISYFDMNNQITFTQEVHEGKEPNINDQISYANMNSQVTVHEGKEPFKCQTCHACFSQKGDLNKHIASVHEKKKPFPRDGAANSSNAIYTITPSH